MARLRASDAITDVPLTVARVTLEAEELGLVMSVAPFRGQQGAVRDAIGGWPEPGRWIAVNGGRLVWEGTGRALAIRLQMTGDAAALSDQSDAWIGLRLSGAGLDDVLARLCPLDLRPRSFGEGSVARTLLEHIGVLVLRDAEGVLILVPRSLAQAAREALGRAMDQAVRGDGRSAG